LQKNQGTDIEKGGKETQLPVDQMGDDSPMGEMRQEKYFLPQNILSRFPFHQMFAPIHSEVTISHWPACSHVSSPPIPTYIPSFSHTSYSSTLIIDAACSS
jgi:hypothetical protein